MFLNRRPRLILPGDPSVCIIGEDDSGQVSTGYVPRPLQYKLHRALTRFNVIVCHRRFGKTVFSINHMIDRALRSQLPMPRFAYIAPNYGQAKRVVWDQLKHYTAKIPGVEVNEADLRVDIPGNKARIMLLSAENYPTLKGIYLDGVILDEYAEMNPATWSEGIRPTLSDRKGWGIFIGTPKGQNNFYELHKYATEGKEGELDPEWYAALYRASETGIIDQTELDSARRVMTEDEYEQEYECSFVAALSGAYFAKELAKAIREGRVAKAPHDPMIPVDTAWDLGWNDTTAVWFFQSVRGQHRFIDYYEISGTDLPTIAADLKRKNYNYGRTLLPHDGASGNLVSGKTPQQVLWGLGWRQIEIIPRVKIKRDAIDASRIILPRCEFDAVKCERGLKALTNYQRKFDSKNNVFAESPLHNWASNGADAFQQFALGCRDDSRNSSVNAFAQQRRPFTAVTEYDPFESTGVEI